MKKSGITLKARLVAMILAMLCAAALFAGCAKQGNGDGSTTAAGDSTAPATPDTTADIYEKDDLPETIDLNEKVTILYGEDAENVEFFASEDASDSVEFAIKNRNSRVEKRLNVEMDFVGTPGNYNNRAKFEQVVSADFMSGKTYDIFAAYSMSVANCAYSGYCANLLDYSVINFEKPWWPRKLTSEALINGKLYLASGDISTNMLYMMYVMYFAKQLVTNNNLENPYDLVDAGTWTIDKMVEMAETFRSDLDDDNKIYGLATSSNVHYDPFFYGAGLRTIDKDASGQLIVSELFGGEKAVNTAAKMTNFLNGGLCTDKKGNVLFRDGRALFSVSRARYASQELSDTDIGFGVIPMPKYDTDQEGYSTCLGFPYTLYAISAGSSHAEAAAYLLEALASEGYRTVTPALFEVSMKVRYVDDPTAARMFDIVRDSVSFDVGRIFTSSLNNYPFKIFRDSLTNNESYSLNFSRAQAPLKASLKKFNAQFEKIANQ